jgi:hypothetical protein
MAARAVRDLRRSDSVKGYVGFVKLAGLAGSLYGALMFPFFAVALYICLGSETFSRHGALAFASALGIGCGAFFGLAMAAYFQTYCRRRDRWFGAMDPREPGERVLKQGGAARFTRRRRGAGYLWLTSERLLFERYGGAPREPRLSIPLGDVTAVRPYRVLSLVPRGIEVTSAEGSKERFKVEERHDGWTEGVRRAAARAQETS